MGITLLEILFGSSALIYIANRQLYKYFFNPKKRIQSLSVNK